MGGWHTHTWIQEMNKKNRLADLLNSTYKNFGKNVNGLYFAVDTPFPINFCCCAWLICMIRGTSCWFCPVRRRKKSDGKKVDFFAFLSSLATVLSVRSNISVDSKGLSLSWIEDSESSNVMQGAWGGTVSLNNWNSTFFPASSSRLKFPVSDMMKKNNVWCCKYLSSYCFASETLREKKMERQTAIRQWALSSLLFFQKKSPIYRKKKKNGRKERWSSIKLNPF